MPAGTWVSQAVLGERADRRRPPGVAPEPHQEALPLGSPPRGEAPWDLFIWVGGRGGPTETSKRVGWPSSPTYPMDRLQRASPFAGGPGGKASWRVRGRRPRASAARATSQYGLTPQARCPLIAREHAARRQWPRNPKRLAPSGRRWPTFVTAAPLP